MMNLFWKLNNTIQKQFGACRSAILNQAMIYFCNLQNVAEVEGEAERRCCPVYTRTGLMERGHQLCTRSLRALDHVDLQQSCSLTPLLIFWRWAYTELTWNVVLYLLYCNWNKIRYSFIYPTIHTYTHIYSAHTVSGLYEKREYKWMHSANTVINMNMVQVQI